MIPHTQLLHFISAILIRLTTLLNIVRFSLKPLCTPPPSKELYIILLSNNLGVAIAWYQYLGLQLPVQAVYITIKVLSSNPRSWRSVLYTPLCDNIIPVLCYFTIFGHVTSLSLSGQCLLWYKFWSIFFSILHIYVIMKTFKLSFIVYIYCLDICCHILNLLQVEYSLYYSYDV